MRFTSGAYVVLYLQNPREKIFGILGEITASGIELRGIDLDYFDDWSRAIANHEPYLPMNEYFYPMWRVERVTRDETGGEVPSLAAQFEERTGMRVSDV